MLNSFEEVRAASQERRGGETRAAGRAGAAPGCGRGAWAALAAAVLVAACGGGGSGSGSGGDGNNIPRVTEFKLGEAFRRQQEQGSDQTLKATYVVRAYQAVDPATQQVSVVRADPPVTCNGTVRLVTQASQDDTFETRPTKRIAFTEDFEAPGCRLPNPFDPQQPLNFVPNDNNGDRYFEVRADSYGALGARDILGYGRYESPPGTPSQPGPLSALHLPNNVSIGDKGMLGTRVTYSDGTLAARRNQLDVSYEVVRDINPDGSVSLVSVLVILTAETYNNANVLTSRQTDTYRLTGGGSLTLLRRVFDSTVLTLTLTP